MDRTNKHHLLWVILACGLSQNTFAADLKGLWKHVDDKTGAIKAVMQVRQEANGSYSAKILKVLGRQGFSPTDSCVSCPAPFTGKPIIGLDVLSGLSEKGKNQFEGGRLLDPFNGEMMNTKAKVSSSGNRLMLRNTARSQQARTQVWMRLDSKN